MSPSSGRDAALAALFARTGTKMKLGLDRVTRLLASLGDPQRSFETLVVGGTNGKGSVAVLTAAVLERSGMRTGLFLSPHVRDYRERIRVNGQGISDHSVTRFVEQHTPLLDRTEATFFESTTALAFEEFREKSVDVAVLEVGMGGRLDATNVTSPRGAAITTIHADHVRALGPSLVDIAAEKYPISRPGRPLVVGRVPPAVRRFFREAAARDGVVLVEAARNVRKRVEAVTPKGMTVTFEGPFGRLEGVRLRMLGLHQADNGAVVLALLHATGYPAPEEAVRRAFAETQLEGRFEWVPDQPVPTVVDVGHNPAGIGAAVRTWRMVLGDRRPVVVFSALGDKDLPRMLRLLEPFAAEILVPPLDTPRAVEPEVIVTCARERGCRASPAASVAEAIDRAARRAVEGNWGGVLCVGSFYLAGQALAEYGAPAERSRAIAAGRP